MRNGVLAVLLLLAAGEALLALAACTGTEGERCIMPDSTMRECREGDIVLRKGTGMTSRIVCAAEGSEDYSHCGIVARAADGRLVVVHAVPDEPDFEGDPDRVKSEPIESFFSHIKAQRGRILRLAADSDSTKAVASARTAMAICRRHVLFDHDYDDRDTTRMYCSELVNHAYASNGIELAGDRRHDFNVPGLRIRHVILPADFIGSPRVRTVAVFPKTKN